LTIAEYRKDGTLDPAFGGGGKLRHDFSPGTDDVGWTFCAVAVQRDGWIVVGGGASYGPSEGAIVARFDRAGNLDQSFGESGVVHLDGVVSSLVIQPDRRIVAAAYGYTARLLPDGSLDPSFGDGGQHADHISPSALAVQSDGKIVVGGVIMYGGGAGTTVYSALERLNTDGSLDTTFSGDGKRTGDVDTECTCGVGVALQPDGRILYRVEWSGTPDFPLLRYLPDGHIDRTFGHRGEVTPHIQGTDMAVQANGKILLAGYPGERRFAVLRLRADGRRDRSFGTDGFARAWFATHAASAAVSLQPDGRIVAVGSAGKRFALARFLPR
jgi:uncharacterized delta-60 repeat protein